MPSSDLEERHDTVTPGQWSPHLFEALVRDNPDMVAVVDLDGRFRFVSEAVRRILGLDPDDLVDRDGFEFIHPDDVRLAAESMATTVGLIGSSPRLIGGVAAGSSTGICLFLFMVSMTKTKAAIRNMMTSISGMTLASRSARLPCLPCGPR